jgi:plastocyanin
MKLRGIFLFILAVAAVSFVACGGGSEEAAAPEAAAAPAPAPGGGSTGSIAGTVSYANGDVDAEIAMDADPVCVSLHPDAVYTQKIVADDGTLANAFVYVKEGAAGGQAPPAESATLDQKGCMYTPHVSGVQVGQTVVIRNSDATLHNVHAMPANNAEFNNGQPFEGMELEHTFDSVEVMVPFKCDVHPWMSSYMGVLDHPFFAVTGDDGMFSIDGLPAGDYVLEVWHEELGTQEMAVSVAAGAAAEADFDFSPAG